LCGFSGKFGTVFKVVVQPLIHPKICVAIGTNFKAAIQPFGGTEIKEQTYNLLQKILERVLRSFAHFPVWRLGTVIEISLLFKFLKMNML
jgi:hypothetical protein